MIHVLFTWYAEGAGGQQTRFFTSMPQVPAKGDTVWVPVNPDAREEDDIIAKRVFHVGWCDDNTVRGGWHAEVALT